MMQVPELLKPVDAEPLDTKAPPSKPSMLAEAAASFSRDSSLDAVHSLETVATIDPEGYAKASAVSRFSGVPAKVLYDQRDRMDQLLRGNQYASMMQQYRKTANALRDGNMAAITQDDLDQLTRIEGAAADARFNQQSLGEKLYGAIQQQWVAMRQSANVSSTADMARYGEQFDRVDAELLRAAEAGVEPFEGQDPGGFAGEYLRADPEQRQVMRQNLLSSQAERLQSVAQDEETLAAMPVDPGARRAAELEALGQSSLAATAEALVENPGYAVRTAVGAGATSAPMLLAGAVGGPLAAAPIGFGMEFDAKLADVLREAGVDFNDPKAVMRALQDDELMADGRKRAALKASGTTAVDMISMGLASKLLVPGQIAGRTLSKTQRELANLAVQFPVQGITEGAGEAAGQLLAEGEVDAGEVLLETVAGAGMSSLDVLAFSNQRLIEQMGDGLRRIRQAKVGAEALGEMVDASLNSKTRGRDVETFRAMAEQQLADSPMETIWLPAEALNRLNQSAQVNLPEILQQVPGLAEQFADAAARGGSVSMKTADYLALFADYHDQLGASVRVPVDGMSLDDAESWNAEQEAQLDELAESLRTPEDPAVAMSRQMVGELIAAGYRRADAEQYASTHLAVMQTLAERTGVALQDLAERFALDVGAQAPEQLRAVAVDDARIAIQRLRAGDIPRPADMFGQTLREYLVSTGGLADEGGELANLDADVGRVGRNRLARATGGRSIDEAVMDAWERGYFPGVAREDVGPQLLIDAVQRELAGDPVYSVEQENATLREQADTLNQLQEYLDRLGVDIAEMSDDEVLALLQGQGGQMEGQRLDQGSQRFSEDNRLSNLSMSGPSWERIRAANPSLRNVRDADAEVTIYRATVGDSIRPDDFVAVDRSVAEMELENVIDRDGEGAEIIEQQVKVRDLLMGNDATEFVYFPEQQRLNQSAAFVSDASQITGLDDELQQMASELLDNGAQITADGRVRLYHRTSAINAEQIRETGSMTGAEDGLFFSTKRDGQASEFGDAVIEMAVPLEELQLDDAFGDEAHVRVPLEFAGEVLDVSRWIERPGQVLFQSAAGKQTDTEAFRKWFGDSKVVDENGEPLPLWHGSAANFNAFDLAYASPDDPDVPVVGFHLSSDKGRARGAAESDNRQFFVAIRNPATVTQAFQERRRLAESLDRTPSNQEVTDSLAAQGYDGIIMSQPWAFSQEEIDRTGRSLTHPGADNGYELVKEGDEYNLYSRGNLSTSFDSVEEANETGGEFHVVAFRPEQIKSAIGNRGTFDPASPNILEQSGDDDARGFITFQPRQQAGERRKFQITLGEKRDLTTLLHELGHFYLEVIDDVAAQADAPEQIVRDVATIRAWVGAEQGQAFTVEQHEQFARGFEKYLAEGKAPNPDLAGTFARFKRWIIGVYKDLTRLNVELTDDVRRVFDRLVATDEQITAAEQVSNAVPLFADAAAAGWTDAEFAAYADSIALQHAEAQEKIEREIQQEEERRRSKWWREETDRVRNEVAEEIDTLPEYAAMRALRSGVMPDGTRLNIKLNSAELTERYGVSTTRKLAFTHARTGQPLDLVAPMLGYQSGDQMVKAMLGAVPRSQMIKQETDQRMTERHGQRTTGEAAEAALDAVHNERRADVLTKELLALGKQGNRRNITSQQILKEAARRIMSERKVRDIQPAEYQRAEAKAGRQAFEALAKGDLDAAYEAKQRQLLNFYLYREARKARESVDSIVARMAKYNKRSKREQLGKAGADYLDQIDTLMEQYEFRTVSLREIDQRVSFQAWYADQLAKGNEPYVPEFVLNNSRRTNYKELSLAQLQELDEFAANVNHLAKTKNRLLANQRLRDFDEARNAMISAGYSNLEKRKAPPIDKNTRTMLQKLGDGAGEFSAALLKMEQIVDWLDGGQIDGPWSTVFWQPFVEAQAEKERLNREFAIKMTELVDAYTAERGAKVMQQQTYIPGLGQSLSHNAILSAALNTGNASNREKLLNGYGWTEQQLQEIIGNLNASDWAFVQSLWDLVEELWPSIEALEKDLHGIPPAKVEAVPVVTQFGEFRGGYWPLVYDTSSAAYAGVQNQLGNEGGLFEQGYARATTPKGHTKARVDSFAAPIMLDVEIIAQHLGQVIHDLTHRKAIRDGAKIIGDRQIKQMLIDTLGADVANQFNPWLQGVANDMVLDSQKGIDAWTRGAERLRANLAIGWMGFSATTGIQQVLGYSQTFEYFSKIGAKRYIFRGMQEFIRAPFKAVEFVNGLSPEMRFRVDNLDRDMRGVLKKIAGKSDALSVVQRLAFKHIAVIQALVDYPTWLAGYYHGLDTGLSPADAVSAGDRAVRLSQMAAGPKDLAAIQRKDGLMRALTIVYSYFNLLYNRQVDIAKSLKTAKGMADYLNAFERTIFLIAIPAVAGPLVMGNGPGDDEDWRAWAALKISTYPLLGIPGVRDLASSIESGWGYKGATPLGELFVTLNKLATIGGKAIEGEEQDLERITMLGIEAVGYGFGLPVAQPKRTLRFMFDVAEGDVEPEGVTDWMRGLLFGPPKE